MPCSDVLFIDNFVGYIIADSQCSKNVHKDMKSLGRGEVIFHKNESIQFIHTEDYRSSWNQANTF